MRLLSNKMVLLPTKIRAKISMENYNSSVSVPFKRCISEFVENRALIDPLFAKSFSNIKKNIDDCVSYILNEVKKSGISGFCDDEIYSYAIHYYNEENIVIPTSISSFNVVVNHTVELTEEEREKIKQDAIQKIQNEQYFELKRPKIKNSKKTSIAIQPSLFD